MTARGRGSLVPGYRGERAPRVWCGRILSPLSPSLLAARAAPGLRRVALLCAAWLLFALPASSLETAWAGPGLGHDAPSLGDQLEEVVSRLRSACGCDSLRVEWKAGETLWTSLRDLEARRVQVRGEEDDCPEPLVVQVRGVRDGRPQEFLLTGEAACKKTVYRSTRSLRAGTVIEEDDLILVTDWVSPHAASAGEVEVLGSYLEQSIRSGEVLDQRLLRSRPFVRRGHPFVVIYDGPGLELRARATARRDGWINDRLLVRVEGAKKDCQVIVTAPGEARVVSEGSIR